MCDLEWGDNCKDKLATVSDENEKVSEYEKNEAKADSSTQKRSPTFNERRNRRTSV